ncbi:MAG: hypothetical protein AAF641_03125 [Pseudomonadota bacterium]
MRHALAIIGISAGFALPAMAATGDWQDLQDRCEVAVLGGEKLNVVGLDDRLPDILFDVVESDLLGPRVEVEFSALGGRTVPTGVWGTKDGAFELWLIEYPTRAGFRAICEVRQARGQVIGSEAVAALEATFKEVEAPRIDVSRDELTAFRLTDENPRGCPVVTSFSAGSALRSSVSEAVGVPDCGGPSLAGRVITPHGILPGSEGEDGG